MARNFLLLSIYSLYTLLLLLDNSNAFTLELTHPNSDEPSFYKSFSSYEERIRRSVSQSFLRANSITASRNQKFIEIARPIIDLQEFIYIAKIGIGTFKSQPPFKEYYLDVDTGSSFTWMQCEGCTKCFKQNPKPFPKNKSTSFHPILDVTKKPIPYNVTYQDRTHTSGIMAKETLHLNSNIGSNKRVQEFIFGCGLVNNLEYGGYKNNRIAGIMGLGWGDYSFVNQIKESKGRFSYCLPLVNFFTQTRGATYLRFGDDIIQGSNNPSSTTMIKVEGKAPYYIGLQGISINGKRLNISNDVFALKFNGPNKRPNGGCIIDSGAAYSHIVGPAYDKLKEGLEGYFSKDKNLKRINNGYSGLDLCYERRKAEGFKNLPDITFHFKGSKSDFHVRPQGGFEVAKRLKLCRSQEYVCLAVLRSKHKSIIGVQQQTNQRIIFDTQKKKLIFHSEDCSKNP